MLQVHGHLKDLGGGFQVSRLLPAVARRAVGPFVFVDLFGPTTLAPEMNIDVRPHPHIGLATVTYLFDGAMMHRDSLGSVQRIDPGAINLMSAGRGIVHSERTPEELRGTARALHGLQLWVALPRELEESEPTFQHTAAAAMPRFEEQGADVHVLAGAAFGHQSPVTTLSPTLMLSIRFGSSAMFELPPLAQETALLPINEEVVINGHVIPAGVMAILEKRESVRLSAAKGTRVMVLGGDALDGPRHLWWNFVSTSKERIARAAEDWQQMRMGTVPGEDDFIPLPATPLP